MTETPEELRARLEALQAETDQLRAENQAFREFIKYSPGANAIFDDTMHYLAVSDGFVAGYGITGEPYLGRTHYEVFPEVPQRWKDIHSHVLDDHIEREDADGFEREDGTITYNKWECRPWYQPDGKVGGLIMFTEVVTEQIKTREERDRLFKNLQTSMRRFRAMMLASPDMMFIIDKQGNFLFVKEAEALPANAATMTGKSLYDFYPVSFVNQILNLITLSLTKQAIQSTKLDLKLPGRGHTSLALRCVPYENEQVILSARDTNED